LILKFNQQFPALVLVPILWQGQLRLVLRLPQERELAEHR
jgi:hypothetical protein